VTGNASGPLGAYLLRHGIARTGPDHRFSFRARQGDAMGRPGAVHVEARQTSARSPIEIRIAGDATIVFETELTI
jgi:predicted PhzF superfamily epimerase YddE/YHI9